MRRIYLILLIMVSAGWLSAQSTSPVDQILDQGKTYYEKGDYLAALTQFQKLVADPEGRLRGDPFLWLSKTYFAVLDLKNASLNLDYFIQNFPRDPGQTEAAYLQARVLFASSEYEKSLQAFGLYLDLAPNGDQVPNALFWMGEAAFSLGRYSEASSLYSRIVKGYPASYKLEASRYRLAVIELRQREEELLKLLRWSHAESLNSAEEFQRREKAYQQTIISYQKKVLDLQATDVGSRFAALEETIKQRDAQIAALKLQLSGGADRLVSAPQADQTMRNRLLELKSRALDLKAFYLSWKDPNANP